MKLKDIKLPAMIAIIGKTGSGKSTIAKNIVYYKQKVIRLPLFISETSTINNDFKNIISEPLTFDQFPPDALSALFKQQEKLIKEKNKGNKKYTKAVLDAFIIFDDMLGSGKRWLYHPVIRTLAYQCRHWQISWIFCVQDPMSIPDAYRSQIAYTIFTQQKTDRIKKKIYENYWNSDFGNYQIFAAILQKCTSNYNCLIIDNKNMSGKFDETVFCAKVHDSKCLPPFQLGSRKILKIANRKYNPNWEEEVRKKEIGNSKKTPCVVLKDISKE